MIFSSYLIQHTNDDEYKALKKKTKLDFINSKEFVLLGLCSALKPELYDRLGRNR
jgi:hypothetical protein